MNLYKILEIIFYVLTLATFLFYVYFVLRKIYKKKKTDIVKQKTPEIKTPKISKELADIKEMYIAQQKNSNLRQNAETAVVKKNFNKKTYDFVDFNNTDNIVPESEISKQTLDDRVPKLRTGHSKYQFAPKVIRKKKLSIKKLKRDIKNITPEMQALLFTNIMEKKQ